MLQNILQQAECIEQQQPDQGQKTTSFTPGKKSLRRASQAV
ncbi:hypothetical protein CNE_BB2p01440 (plasmid) [Cupriavidus necator N-1]|uniref:Uncharacterized protein n=1 Tax=Cupriavidus necator (strain ATCC 43291 / DSM 13513 / CCUG 52238 / LMG 8453 / N-1) TaxID=1042878 RepID=F8GYL4_CUPNN|nr:hypothetical protein CNE_BB2p01440 [Cupriavidus necator N-1]